MRGRVILYSAGAGADFRGLGPIKQCLLPLNYEIILLRYMSPDLSPNSTDAILFRGRSRRWQLDSLGQEGGHCLS